MTELLQGLMDKVGLDEDKAKSVISFLQENASKVPEWLGGADLGNIKDKVGGMLGLGGDD